MGTVFRFGQAEGLLPLGEANNPAGHHPAAHQLDLPVHSARIDHCWLRLWKSAHALRTRVHAAGLPCISQKEKPPRGGRVAVDRIST